MKTAPLLRFLLISSLAVSGLSLAGCGDNEHPPADKSGNEGEGEGGEGGRPGDGQDGLNAIAIETQVSKTELVVGSKLTITCFLDGIEDDTRTRIILAPDSLALVEGRELTAVAPGDLDVACQLTEAGRTDDTPAKVTITEAGERTIDTVLDKEEVTAGDLVTVTCEARDSLGDLLDVDTEFSVSPDPGDSAVGPETITPSEVGAYEVTCKIVDGAADDTPAELTVTMDLPTSLTIEVRPHDDIYDRGDEVTITAQVTDQYGNVGEADGVQWIIEDGITDLGEGEYRLDEVGEFEVEARLNTGARVVQDEVVLVVDGVGPVIELLEPERGAVRSGEQVIRVAGRAFDDGTGLAAVRINGDEVDVDVDGSFETDVDATFGLNLIRIETEDEGGAVERTTRGVLWSPEKLAIPTEADPEGARRPEGMVAFLGQEALDDRDHPCDYNEAGAYVCDEVDDLATVLEIILNNMDADGGDPVPVFDQTFPLVGEGTSGDVSLGDADFVLPPFFDYHGEIVLHWSTEIAIDVQVVAEMDNMDINSYESTLNAREGGFVAGGALSPEADAPGISADLDLRAEVSVEAFVRIDSLTWGPDDVTLILCGNDFIPPLLVGFLEELTGAELSEPLCEGAPAASVYPEAQASGGGFAIDSLQFEADMAAGLNEEGEPDVSMEDVELILGPGDVDLTAFEQLTFDLGEVRVLDLIELDLGEFEADLGFLQVLTDALIDPLVNIARDDTRAAIERAIDCSDDQDCFLDLASAMEIFLASMAGSRIIPTEALAGTALTVLDGAEPVILTTDGVFSLLEFTEAGGVLGLATLATANAEPSDDELGELEGILSRAQCDVDDDAVPGEADADLQYAVHVDHWNQALHSAWRTGVGHRSFSEDELPRAPRTLRGDVLEVVFEPVGPIAASSCNAKGDVHLLAGDVKVTVTLDSDDSAQDVVGWISLDRVTVLEVDNGDELSLVMDELAGVLWEPTEVPDEVRAQAASLGDWLTGDATPAWLQSIGEATLTSLATPSFNLGGVPGVPEGLVVRVAARDVAALDGYQMVRGALTADAL